MAEEDDLVKIYLHLYDEADGDLTLSAPQGASKIKVWESKTKETNDLITLPKTWDLSGDDDDDGEEAPWELWVEGINASDDPRDVRLLLEYSEEPEGAWTPDEVRFTVVLIESVVLKDKKSRSCKVDQANGGPPPPGTLYVATADDGKGDVEFWVVSPEDEATYNWEIKETDNTPVDSGTLSEGNSYKDEKTDLAPKEYYLRVTKQNGGDYERKINFTVVKVELETISFNYTGAPDAIGMKDHVSDNPLTVPEWDKDNAAADNEPALYAKNTTFGVKAKFSVQPTEISSAKIWATGGFGGLNSSASPVTVNFDANGQSSGNDVFTINTAPTGVSVNDITWTWKVKDVDNSGSAESDIGISSHKVFICNAKPSGYTPYKYVAWWSCDWATGKTTGAEIVEAIYQKVDETGTTGPSVDLDYVFPDAGGGSSTRSLLQDAKGSCGDWQYFFRDQGKVHNVNVSIDDVKLFPLDNTFYDMFGDTGQDIDGDNSPGYTNWDDPPPGPYIFAGTWIFPDHSYCSFGNTVYDPSLYHKHTGDWESYFKWLFEKYAKVDMTGNWREDATKWDWDLKADCDNQKVRLKHRVDDGAWSDPYRYPPW